MLLPYLLKQKVMKKYIIIETWNGEGYTDSSAEIMEFKDGYNADLYCLGKAKSEADAMGTKCYSTDDNFGYGYTDNDEENAGAFAFEEIVNDVIGVVINPCLNDYEVVADVKRWDELVAFAWKHGTIEEDQEDFGEGKVNNQYIHSGGESGDALFIELDGGTKEQEEESLKLACLKLIKAIGRNSTDLWNPDLEETTTCIVLDKSEIVMDLDHPDVISKFAGIEKELQAVEDLLENKDKPKDGTTSVDGVEIKSVDVVFYGERNQDEDYDFGALTLKCEDREYILDVVQTFWTEGGGFTTVECHVEVDTDVFPENKYNLTKEDLILGNVSAELYVGGTFSNTVENINLFIDYNGLVKAINVEED